jgi:hypothetical protein
MGRECKVLAAAGMKGCGKTVSTIKMLDQIVRGNPAKGIRPRKALILDANDEFSDFWFYQNPHRRIPAIAIKDLPRFTMSNIPEIRRIRPFFDDGRKMSLDDLADTLTHILSIYRGGALLCEDPSKYIGDSIKSDLIGALATCRHLSIDLILHYQSIGKIAQPKLFGNTSYVRLHKTNDSVARHATKFQDKVELFQIAENIVNRKYFEEDKKRFYLIVDNDESKIHQGEESFNDADITEAIQEYIDNNRTSLIKPLMNKVDLSTGRKVFDEKGALLYVAKRLRKTYFE